MSERADRYDILIAGAGFAGAITALVLHSRGFSVCLVEKGRHPRFAIGESSTPIADLLLRDLSVRYDLPWLYAFSRYGSWQEAHPEIVCGIKRGFSYFKHYPFRAFSTDAMHSEELLVAASSSDRLSDTNWLRAGFDAFLVEKVQEAHIRYLDLTNIVSAKRDGEWQFKVAGGDAALTIHASFFIDATGGGDLLDRLLGVRSPATGFDTDSRAIFSHFDAVPGWMDVLRKAAIPTDDYPYNPDDSALHHILDEGWMWVLRFNDRRTSLGFALDSRWFFGGEQEPEQQWARLLSKYPTIGGMLDGVSLSAVPGRIIRSGRLQRKAERCAGAGWAALPHSAGFVDPLFSPGIAHSLMGIRRLAGILERQWDHGVLLEQELREYEHAVFTELRLVDRLVAGCYRTMADFPLFRVWSMLYFAATINCEQRLLRGEAGGYFLSADDPAIGRMVDECWFVLARMYGDGWGRGCGAGRPGVADAESFTALVRERIAPFNSAGLMEPGARHMYRHTVAEL